MTGTGSKKQGKRTKETSFRYNKKSEVISTNGIDRLPRLALPILASFALETAATLVIHPRLSGSQAFPEHLEHPSKASLESLHWSLDIVGTVGTYFC